ncbi:MAG: hypothetical protein ACPGVT_01690 [Maricaulaceae bacterium]
MDEMIIKLYSEYIKLGDKFYLLNDTWSKLSVEKNIPLSETLDQFFTRLALMYNKGQINYEFGDICVNEAYGEWIFQDRSLKELVEFPPKFWQVYLAFDDGEWHRKEDGSDDPVAKYTDPQIRDFLREYNIVN